MQKKLIALAIAGLASSAAFAQTNVTLYGVVDATLETAKASGSNNSTDIANTQKVNTNGSYIGFKGSEDLGNGLKAIFQIETNLRTDGSGALVGGTRDTFVGLSGGFGTLKAGNLTGPTRNLAANVEFSPGWQNNGITSALTGAIGTTGTGADGRLSNAILYTSPSFSNFSADLGYSAASETNSTITGQKDRSITAGLSYSNGPIYVAYAYLKSDEVTTGLVGAFDDVTVHKIGGTYAFGSGTTLAALFDRSKFADASGLGAGEVERDAWMIGVNQAFGGVHNVWAQFAKADELEGSALANAGTEAKQYTLGYSYTMSKRTMLHAYYTKIKQEANLAGVSYDFAVNPVGLGGAALGSGSDPQSMGVGLRHAF